MKGLSFFENQNELYNTGIPPEIKKRLMPSIDALYNWGEYLKMHRVSEPYKPDNVKDIPALEYCGFTRIDEHTVRAPDIFIISVEFLMKHMPEKTKAIFHPPTPICNVNYLNVKLLFHMFDMNVCITKNDEKDTCVVSAVWYEIVSKFNIY